MLFVDDNDQHLGLLVEVGDELLRFCEKVNSTDARQILGKVFRTDADPIVFDARCEVIIGRSGIVSSGTNANGTMLLIEADDHLVWSTKRVNGSAIKRNAKGTQSHNRRSVFEIREIEIESHDITPSVYVSFIGGHYIINANKKQEDDNIGSEMTIYKMQKNVNKLWKLAARW